MGNYEFKCGDCEKVINVSTTGDIPEFGDELECINCGRISRVTSSCARLDVVKTEKIKKPSELEKLEKEKKNES